MRNRNCEVGRKSVTAIVVNNVDFILWTSNFGDVVALRATFSYIFTAHAQKADIYELSLKRLTLAIDVFTRISVAYRDREISATGTFLVNCIIEYAGSRPFFCFRSIIPIHRKYVVHFAPYNDKLKLIRPSVG